SAAGILPPCVPREQLSPYLNGLGGVLGLLGGDEVQTLVKFVNLPSPHPLPSPLGGGWPQAGGVSCFRRPDPWREEVARYSLRLLVFFRSQLSGWGRMFLVLVLMFWGPLLKPKKP